MLVKNLFIARHDLSLLDKRLYNNLPGLQSYLVDRINLNKALILVADKCIFPTWKIYDTLTEKNAWYDMK